MIELAEETLFAILRHFGDGRNSTCVLSAKKVTFVPPVALDLVDEGVIDLRECYSILLNIFPKELVDVHVAHF